jgi:hypothetical protein
LLISPLPPAAFEPPAPPPPAPPAPPVPPLHLHHLTPRTVAQ